MNKKILDRYGHRKKKHKIPKILRYSNLNIHQKINIKNEYADSMHLAKNDTVGGHGQPRRALQSIFWMDFKFPFKRK